MSRTDASIAFSVTDNLSQSVTRMRNSMNEFRDDVEGLQSRLDVLENTRYQLRNISLVNARQEMQRAERALRDLSDTATETEREMARADFETAVRNYETLRQQLDLVSRQSRQTTRDLMDATDAIRRAENRADTDTSQTQRIDLSALGDAGLIDMAGDVAMDIANLAVSSSLGSELGGIVSSGISGAASGAAMGSLAGPLGAAIGGAIGGALGLAQGGAQALENREQSFIEYYTGVYDSKSAALEESQSTGSSTAAQRELDAISFDTLITGGDSATFLSNLTQMAARTPFEYDDLTEMTKSLSVGFGDDPDRIFSLIQGVGDAGATIGASASDMSSMATALSRMQASDQAQLEELNIFQDRGINVLGMLAEAYHMSVGDIRGEISKGEIGGRDAVSIIQQGLGQYAGAMDTMSQTFEGLTSTLSDTMNEISTSYGTGYNEVRKRGLETEIDTYSGPLGEVMSIVNDIAGQNDAYMQNLSEQYEREALSAVLLGKETTLFSDEDKQELLELRQKFSDASALYEQTGDRTAAIAMESAQIQAESIAQFAYENSELFKATQEAEATSLDALRQNTSALEAATTAYSVSQQRTKGNVFGIFTGLSGIGSSTSNPQRSFVEEDAEEDQYVVVGTKGRGSYKQYEDGHIEYFAKGITRVPYDNYPAMLHEGERVLTAREARELDRLEREISHSESVSTFAYSSGSAPHNGDSAVLHDEEWILTAQKIQELDRPSHMISPAEELVSQILSPVPKMNSDVNEMTGSQQPVYHITVQVSDNTFGAGLDENAVAEKIANEIAVKVAAGFGR